MAFLCSCHIIRQTYWTGNVELSVSLAQLGHNWPAERSSTQDICCQVHISYWRESKMIEVILKVFYLQNPVHARALIWHKHLLCDCLSRPVLFLYQRLSLPGSLLTIKGSCQNLNNVPTLLQRYVSFVTTEICILCYI